MPLKSNGESVQELERSCMMLRARRSLKVIFRTSVPANARYGRRVHDSHRASFAGVFCVRLLRRPAQGRGRRLREDKNSRIRAPKASKKVRCLCYLLLCTAELLQEAERMPTRATSLFPCF